jgi:tRNA threonylcarbamoyladenosine biosynthesis protein TsaE
MNSVRFVAQSESDTDRLGRILAEILPDGLTVGLQGTLGAGKTRLVQAIARGCGIEPRDVVSPTFTLCNEYRGNRWIDHIDLYRVRDIDEWNELGFDEYFDSSHLVFVEWSDRFADWLPSERLEIAIEVLGPNERVMTIRSLGDRYRSVVQRLQQRLSTGH